MVAEGNTRHVRARGDVPAASAADAGRAGAPPITQTADASLVLPCPLLVLGTTRDVETGRPLADLLPRVGYP